MLCFPLLMAYRNGVQFDLSFCNDLSNKSLTYCLECSVNAQAVMCMYLHVCLYMYLYIHVYMDVCNVFTRTDLLCAYVHFSLTSTLLLYHVFKLAFSKDLSDLGADF